MNKRKNMLKLILFAIFIFFILNISAFGASKQEINIRVEAVLNRFCKEITGGREFLNKAKGILVFPKVVKAGLLVGGEYGEGALKINGKTVDYYSIAAGSLGLQLGVQTKTIVIVFLDEKALKRFRNSSGWKVGVDGSVAIIKWGVGKDINSMEIKKPIVGFIFDNKGLMFNLTIEGSKITKLDK